VLPPQGNYASKWARFTATTNLPTIGIRGVTGAQVQAYQADVKLEVEINVGSKHSNQMEFRGGPARAKIVDGGRAHLVGASFLRKHKIVTK